MESGSRLGTYRAKRDFSRTPEPQGEKRAAPATPLFVVQQHDATRMHYDFRLEVDGVLVSFAVPKGPSTDPHERRLAVRTEDHPLEYAGFEGIIPEGQYGAGAVIVWDGGTYENVSAKRGKTLSMAEALEAGHVKVVLRGSKLLGGWSLVRAKLGGEDKNWLMIKEKDEFAHPGNEPVETSPRSVLSGLTIREIALRGSFPDK